VTRRIALQLVTIWPALSDTEAPDTPRNRVARAANEATAKQEAWAKIMNELRPGMISIHEADAFNDYMNAIDKLKGAHRAWLHPPPNSRS
jgi:hypothetical protein